MSDTPYWVFVCNPQKWAIDDFLGEKIENDHWGVRPSDQLRFEPGQLGIIRVGVDRRSGAARGDKPRLRAGVYAIVEVQSAAYLSRGASPRFWHKDAVPGPGRPTVDLRYLRTYPEHPLLLDTLRAEAPSVSKFLLEGFQAASFPIDHTDFQRVVELLGESETSLALSSEIGQVTPSMLPALEARFMRATPEARLTQSKRIERGKIGAQVKQALGFRCQLCDAMGNHPLGFETRLGIPYCEAHHVMPVSKLQLGSLACSNIMVLCANHHRQMHHGKVDCTIGMTHFEVEVGKEKFSVPRPALLPPAF